MAAIALAGGGFGLEAHELGPPQAIRSGCQSATDGCRVCKLGEAGEVVGCSFPGIACEPGAWSCNAPPKPDISKPEDGKTDPPTAPVR